MEWLSHLLPWISLCYCLTLLPPGHSPAQPNFKENGRLFLHTSTHHVQLENPD